MNLVAETKRLIDKGNEVVRYKEDVVLVIGTSSSGKGTFVQFLAGDSSKLSVKKVNGEMVIVHNDEGQVELAHLNYPTLFTDEALNFYDCPAFDETTDLPHSIAAMYFTKSVLEHAKRVRVILVADYYSFMKEARTEFFKLLKYTSSFIKDCSKFSGSIFLAATGVKEYDPHPVMGTSVRPTDNIISDMFKQLVKIRSELNEASPDFPAGQLLTNAQNLMNCLVSNPNGKPSQLLAFAISTLEGTVKNIYSYEKSRIVKQLSNAPSVSASDDLMVIHFSEEQLKIINDYGDQVIDNIMNKVMEISQHLIYGPGLQAVNSLRKIKGFMAKLVEINSHDPIGDLSLKTKKISDSMQVLDNHLKSSDMSPEIIQSILEWKHEVDFLLSFNSEHLEELISNWMKKVSAILDKYCKTDTWEGFLINLYNELSTYQIQKDRHKYNVKDLEHWSVGGTEGIFITPDNVAQFIEKLKGTIFEQGQPLPDPASIRDSKLNELNDMLTFTVKQDIYLKPIDDVIVIKQNIIRLDEIKQAIINPEYSKMSLKLFATDKIYVDCSLERPSCDVTLIAPFIEVIGKQNISLRGKDFGAFEPSKAATSVNGSSGTNGSDGGNFVAVTMSSLDGLTVDVSGSRGQDGQSGGDGAAGEDGVDAPYKMTDRNIPEGTKGKDWDYILDTYYKSIFRLHAPKSGYKGGNGGNGGSGGKGGDAGIIFTTSQLSNKIGGPGVGGSAGGGGKHGQGGKNGRDRTVTREVGGGVRIPVHITLTDGGLIEVNPERAESGSDGSDGKAGVSGSVKSDELKLASDVTSYKLYGLEMEKNIFFRASMTTFKQQILYTEKLDPLYESEALFKEMTALEDEYHNLREVPNLLSIYTDLSARVARYSQKLDEATKMKSDVDKRLLQVLYTAVLTKVCCLRRGSQRTLIIDIRQYIKTTTDELEIFKAEKFTSTLIEEKKKFGDKIKNRIDEAKFLINTQLSKDIDNLLEKTKTATSDLLKEVASLEKDLKKQREALAKLERQLELAALLGIMKNMMNILDLAGPYGTTANAVIQKGIGIGESFNKIDKEPLNVGEVPKGLEALNKVAEETKKGVNNRVDNLEKLILDMQDKIDKYKSTNVKATSYVLLLASDQEKKSPFSELKSKLSEALAKVRSARASLNRVVPETESIPLNVIETTLDTAQSEVHQAVETEASNINNSPVSSESEKKKKENEIDFIEDFQSLSKAFPALGNTYKDFSEKMDEIKSVSKASGKLFDQLVELDKYGRQVRDVMNPMLDGMARDLKRVSTDLSDKSQVVLDIAKWKVQKKMREMKQILEKSTAGFKVEEQFSSLVVEISEGMTTMIGVYDRIETYKQQAELADHIANMNDRGFGIEKVDGKLGESFQKMRVVIQANIVLDRFEACIEAVKQWVFPFATDFLQDFQLPYHEKPQQTIETLVSDAMTKINRLSTKINDYYSTLKPQHKFVMKGQFNTDSDPTAPFFIWNKDNNPNSISKLLSGDEVLLLADVELGSSYKAAVKFNKILLDFKVADKVDQGKLYSELMLFKINLTHMGNSYYRVKNKIYVIESDEIPLIYSISKDGKSPVNPNDNLSMLINGNLLLSPYAMWKIQLTKIPDTKADFEKIKPYIGKVNLELVGEGTYMDESVPGIPDLDLESFYTLHRTIQKSV